MVGTQEQEIGGVAAFLRDKRNKEGLMLFGASILCRNYTSVASLLSHIHCPPGVWRERMYLDYYLETRNMQA